MSDRTRSKKKEKVEKQEKQEKQEKVKDAKEPESEKANGASGSSEAAATNGAVANGQDEIPEVEPMELPPFEIIKGDRIDPFMYKFQFKNVEYSSGRNKTFLCYLVDQGKPDGLLRGCLEDEHTGVLHSEEAFFTQTLTDYDPALTYTVTWYVSSSPCCACAAKISEVLNARKNIKLTIFSARLFEWEEEAIQMALRELHAAGCKLRVMKPLDFSYTWDTFVEHDDQPLNLWEDCKDNYEYYHEKLADILQ